MSNQVTEKPSMDAGSDRPLVTFALFAYNQEAYIRDAVEGALAQSYEPLEIILSDDCSTDRTFEIMQEMAVAYRGIGKVVLRRNQTNMGLANHINAVAALAKGELIVVAAGDDVSYPQRAEKLTEAWLNSGRRILALESLYRDIDQDSNAIETMTKWSPSKAPDITSFAHSNGFVVGATAAYDRRLFLEFPPLGQHVVHEDRVLPFRALLLRGDIGSIDICLLDYRRNIGLSKSYKSQRAMDSTEYSRRALSDNIQKLIDSNHVRRPEVGVILANNIARYSAEIFAQTSPNNFRNIYRMIRCSGLYWGLRAVAKSIFGFMRN